MALPDKLQFLKTKSSDPAESESSSGTPDRDDQTPEEKLNDSPLTGPAKVQTQDWSQKLKKARDRMNGTGEETYSVWKRSSQRVIMMVIALVIVLGYVFFFTSPMFIKDKEADNDPTPLGEAQAFGEDGDKSMTIDTWRYSPSQGLMELKLDVTNEAYDGRDRYVFQPEFQGVDESELSSVWVEPMVSDPDFIVLIVHNVPADWVGIGLEVFYPGHTKSDPLLELYASADSITRVDHLKLLTSNGYRAAVVDEQIAGVQKQIRTRQKQIQANNTRISNMDKEAQRINSKLALDTEDEQAGDQQSLEAIQEQQQDLEAQNDQLQSEIGQLNLQIAQLTKKRNAYFGKNEDSEDSLTPAKGAAAKGGETQVGGAAVKLDPTEVTQKASAPKAARPASSVKGKGKAATSTRKAKPKAKGTASAKPASARSSAKPAPAKAKSKTK